MTKSKAQSPGFTAKVALEAARAGMTLAGMTLAGLSKGAPVNGCSSRRHRFKANEQACVMSVNTYDTSTHASQRVAATQADPVELGLAIGGLSAYTTARLTDCSVWGRG